MPPHEQMVSDLVATGQDQATLEAMDDASLFEMWKQLKGAPPGGAPPVQMGERHTSQLARDRGKHMQVITLSPRTLKQFAEASAKAAVAQVRKKSRAQEDEEFMAEMVAAGRLTPAQVDRAGGPMRQALTAASPICFGEGKSPRELLMDAIRGGPAVRSYGERLAVGTPGVAGGEEDDVPTEVKGYLTRKHGKRGG